MSTPNMGITLPTDHGSVDVWDTVLDAAFGVVDSHNHTPGRGALIPSGALGIDGDVSWSSSGESFSITDLLSIDFRPSAAADVVLQAAALFVSDGSGALSANELYFRTTSGTNVKMTAGAALNVAAFTGGIGGDYPATGALVVFDDATDSYWFQQQVGAAVRQYARMRSADVDLYEYKAHPSAGVPTTRVRLASPAGLAASYALTFPAALPASSLPLFLSSAGVLSTTGPAITPFSSVLALPATGAAMTFGTNPAAWDIGNTSAILECPLSLMAGSTISALTAFIRKTSAAASTVECQLNDVTLATGAITTTFVQSNSANNPGFTTLSASGLSQPVLAGHAYSLRIKESAVAPGAGVDFVYGWQAVA